MRRIVHGHRRSPWPVSATPSHYRAAAIRLHRGPQNVVSPPPPAAEPARDRHHRHQPRIRPERRPREAGREGRARLHHRPGPARLCVARHRGLPAAGRRAPQPAGHAVHVGTGRYRFRAAARPHRKPPATAVVRGMTVVTQDLAGFEATGVRLANPWADRRETLALDREDAMRFFEALAAPPPPNDQLRAALEEHARRVDSR